MITTSAYQLASRFIGIREVAGAFDNPQIMAMLKLSTSWPEHDEVAWCSAFVDYVAWLLYLPRSKSLRARSWLLVGDPINLMDALPDSDVVIFKRGLYSQPGPEVINAPGHVGFYAGRDDEMIQVLGGNQGDRVSIMPYSVDSLLGVRRLYPLKIAGGRNEQRFSLGAA